MMQKLIEQIQQSGKPIAVDLDHTLLLGNTTWFLCADLMRRKKIYQFRGRSWAVFKAFLAQKGQLNVADLPYRQGLLDFLHQLKAYCPLFLVTGTHQSLAQRIADHLGIFEEAIGSCHQATLTQHRKADFLVSKWGKGNFIYIGDSWRDLPVWDVCCQGFAIPSSWTLSLYLRYRCKRKVNILPFSSTPTLSNRI